MKKALLIFSFLLTLLVFASCSLFEDGYLYIGDGWQDSPEKALAVAADNPMDAEDLTVSILLDKWYIDDRAYMLFVSESDMLVEAEFVANDNDEYHYSGYSKGLPDEFLFDADRSLGNSYSRYGTQVWGYKNSTVKITVNEISPKTKTYTFVCDNKEWSIDRWCIDSVNEEREISIEYATSNIK